jgi:hypothetical protein
MPRQEITVRRLPDGVSLPATEESWSGRVVNIQLVDAANERELRPGALAEIESPEQIYLGVVLAGEQGRLSVDIEHAVNRKSLSQIQRNWNETGS